jgi:hypothetical protein
VILLDTNVIIDALDSGSAHHAWAAKQIVKAVSGDGAAVNAVTVAELCAGDRNPQNVESDLRNWGVQNLVGRYVTKGGGIYWQSGDAKGANPVDLAVQAAKKYPDFFRPWLERVRQLPPTDLEGIAALCSSVTQCVEFP